MEKRRKINEGLDKRIFQPKETKVDRDNPTEK